MSLFGGLTTGLVGHRTESLQVVGTGVDPVTSRFSDPRRDTVRRSVDNLRNLPRIRRSILTVCGSVEELAARRLRLSWGGEGGDVIDDGVEGHL
jgi:hypothetical protein